MSRPQQPELERTGRTDIDPDHAQDRVDGRELDAPSSPGHLHPVPPENQPGHHPAVEEDQPPLDAFAERLGIPTEDASDPGADRSQESGDGEGAERDRPKHDLAAAWTIVTDAVILPLLGGAHAGIAIIERIVVRSRPASSPPPPVPRNMVDPPTDRAR